MAEIGVVRRHVLVAVAGAVAVAATMVGPGPEQRPGRTVTAVGPAATSDASGHEGRDAGLATVGQLLADDQACTAAVVTSRSGRLAMTAAHCVYVPAATERMPDVADGREPGWVEDLQFVPARAGADAPHGQWNVERVWVDRAWQSDATPEVDVAFVELRDSASGTAQEVLGSLGIRFDLLAASAADVLGYPTAAPFDGTRLRRCDGVRTDASYAGVLEARCGLTPGASGGPWIVLDRGGWSAVAVTSYLSIDRPGALGGARLGAVAERLWLAADTAAQR